MIDNEKINIDAESNIENEIISRFPFHGKSKYLIDKLYIIGYDNSTLNKYLFKNENSKNKASDDNIISSGYPFKKMYSTRIPRTCSKDIPTPYDNINEFSIPEKPSLINEFINDYNKIVLDIDITIDMVFPNNPIIYSVKIPKRDYPSERRQTKNIKDSKYNTLKKEIGMNNNDNFDEIKEIIRNKDYFMVFSSNPQIDKKNKKSINGFCYISYCKFREKKLINDYYYIYYVPIGICFISEFPYYMCYYKLAEQIFNLFRSKKIEVPIEIMLYNLINTTLSPINGDIDLCIEPVSFCSNIGSPNSNSLNKKEEKEKENENNNQNNKNEKEITPFDLGVNVKDNDNNNNKKEDLSNSSENWINVEKKNSKNIEIESLEKTAVIKSLNLEKSKTENKKINLFEQIKFPFLQGYPLLQYNLPKILFSNFSIPDLIFIFINSFLEKDILIFSENIGLLSLIINSFQNFNFPLNDNTYYNINASISYNNYINSNCKYISTAMNSMIGINTSFEFKFINESKNRLNEHIIYDLESGDIYINNKNDSNFYQYIKKIIKLKDDKDYKGSLLFYEIKRLYDTLNSIKDRNKNLEEPIQTNYEYLIYNKNINIEIQEAFYKFIVNILIYYYRQLIYQLNLDSFNPGNNKNDDNNHIIIDFIPNYELNIKIKNIEEENYFFDEFKNTFKFGLFFKNFLNDHECLELYHIPYILLEEYISILSNAYNENNSNDYSFNFFKIFQNLYNKKKTQKINIDFNPFLSEYFKKYKDIIERDIKDFNKDGEFIIKYSEFKKALNYQWYELDNRIIIKYIILIKSLSLEEYERIFNLNTILNENISRKILINEIEDEIEKDIFENKYKENGLIINDDDICCMNIIILIAISLKYIDIESYITIIIGYLFKEFFLFRKYYHMLMNMIYKIIKYELNNNNSNNNMKRINNLLALYYTCINSFREKNVIPNEKIINVILKMNQIDHEIRDKMKNINYNEINKNLEKMNNVKDKIDKNNYIIFIYHNFSHDCIISEKNILNYVNKIDKEDENNWKNRLGFIVDFGNERKILVVPKIKYICKYNKNEQYNLSFVSEVFSQRKIKDLLNEEFQKYINSNLNVKALNIQNIIISLLNIFIYIRNSYKFQQTYEISEAFKIILYYYITSTVQ